MPATHLLYNVEECQDVGGRIVVEQVHTTNLSSGVWALIIVVIITIYRAKEPNSKTDCDSDRLPVFQCTYIISFVVSY